MQMKSTLAFILIGLATTAAALPASAGDSSRDWQPDEAFMRASDNSNPYDACKRDAFDYGVMGHYRRLYILSCLDTDLTAAISSHQ